MSVAVFIAVPAVVGAARGVATAAPAAPRFARYPEPFNVSKFIEMTAVGQVATASSSCTGLGNQRGRVYCRAEPDLDHDTPILTGA
jgi:hypothetical protein